MMMSLLFVICMLRGHRQDPTTKGWRPVKRTTDGWTIWLCACSRCGLAYWDGEEVKP